MENKAYIPVQYAQKSLFYLYNHHFNAILMVLHLSLLVMSFRKEKCKDMWAKVKFIVNQGYSAYILVYEPVKSLYLPMKRLKVKA